MRNSIRYRQPYKAVCWTVLAALGLLLAACGEGTATAQPPATSAAQSTPTAQSAPSGTVEMQTTAISATTTPAMTATTGATSPTVTTTIPSTPTNTPASLPTATATPISMTLVSSLLTVPDQWRKTPFTTERHLNLPQGFHISLFASGLGKPRLMAYGPDGDLYVSITEAGRIVRLPDRNNDGIADSAQTFADGLNGPHGLTFHDGWLYVGEYNRVVRLKDTSGDGKADQSEIIVPDLPHGAGHVTRTIGFGPDGKLYVAAGSSCNVCEESDPRRAAISVYDADGKNQRIYASGLRNAVGFLWQPGTNLMYADVNNRDNLGDDVPQEIVAQVTDGANFGWPYCYGDRVWDKDFGKKDPAYCQSVTLPAVLMQAHSAPLGLRFYDGTQFPPQLQGDLFMGFHGSWNRSVATGYKVVYVPFDPATHKPVSHTGTKDFVTGWLPSGIPSGDNAWGRPVDVIVAHDGALLISDDRAGAIYRVTYTGK